jgi:hypothetical protein
MTAGPLAPAPRIAAATGRAPAEGQASYLAAASRAERALRNGPAACRHFEPEQGDLASNVGSTPQ